jgi:outer membrane protein W
MSKLKLFVVSFLSVVILTVNPLLAQTDDYHVIPKQNRNPIQKGDMLVDVFYGGPYLLGLVTKLVYDSLKQQGNEVLNFHNYNQFGAKFQYMLNEKIDIGLEYTHALATFDYVGNNSILYTAGVRKQRVLGKINIHFATSPKVDPYLTFGAGFNSSKLYTNEPGTSSIDLQNTSILFAPISFRAGIGLRYFFTPQFGINAEIGLGGPLMQGGISFKF